MGHARPCGLRLVLQIEHRLLVVTLDYQCVVAEAGIVLGIGPVPEDDTFNRHLLAQVEFPPWVLLAHLGVGLSAVGELSTGIAIDGLAGRAVEVGTALLGRSAQGHVATVTEHLHLGQCQRPLVARQFDSDIPALQVLTACASLQFLGEATQQWQQLRVQVGALQRVTQQWYCRDEVRQRRGLALGERVHIGRLRRGSRQGHEAELPHQCGVRTTGELLELGLQPRQVGLAFSE